jgi:uncharacterized protein (TIGR02145 family)
MYNFYAVSDPRGLCPTGWNVPTDSEWTALEDSLGGSSGAGLKMKSGSPAWDGTNTSGFSGVPGGYIDNLTGSFENGGNLDYLWSSTVDASHFAWSRILIGGSNSLDRYSRDMQYGFSVRCIKTIAAPTVDTGLATGVGATTATLHATFTDGGGTVSAAGFKYATNNTLTGATTVPASGLTSPTTAALTGLSASTQYWAVAFVTNPAGTSYGDTITFTTTAPFACGTTVAFDGYSYATVAIGSDCWFSENLRSTHYATGDRILTRSEVTWTTTTSGAQAIYQGGAYSDTTVNLSAWGRMYNFYAVADPRGLCPAGWHVPTDTDWTALETALGGSSGAGIVMKATSPRWDGTNTSGFSGVPGGYIDNLTGSFENGGNLDYLWSSTVDSSNFAWSRILIGGSNSLDRYSRDMQYGFSVRCVED